MTHWYAVYTREGCEPKVAEILSRKNIQNYCPVVRSTKKLTNGKKVALEPLFNSYVFVKMDQNDLYKLKSIDRIISVVHWLQKPAIIKDIEIEMIIRFLNEHKNPQLEKTEVVINEMVRVIKDPIVYEARNEVFLGYNKIRLILPSLGYSMVAIVENKNERDLSKRETVLRTPTLYN